MLFVTMLFLMRRNPSKPPLLDFSKTHEGPYTTKGAVKNTYYAFH
jgi:hypothetical protein